MKYDFFRRFEDNPILELDDMPFHANSVFNGTPAKVNGKYYLLLRVEGQQGYSFFALAKGTDGYNFQVEPEPVMVPATEGPFARYEAQGIEDPRATWIDDTWYIMYTAVSTHGCRIGLAKTDDFHHFERVAMVSAPGNKDGVLFPEKINDCYVRLDRPIGQGVGSIWVSYSKDLKHWGRSKVVISPRAGKWDSFRIGASVPPIKTQQGWLEIYHGTQMTPSGPIYRTGSVLLDLDDPSRVIARSSVPLQTPRAPYERIGDVGNVIFACGAIVEPDGEVKLYYGGADTCVCVATAMLDDVVAETMNG